MPRPAIDMTGRQFGRLYVDGRAARRNKQGAYWLCTCRCGNTGVVVLGTKLRRGITRSCGCLRAETAPANLPHAPEPRTGRP